MKCYHLISYYNPYKTQDFIFQYLNDTADNFVKYYENIEINIFEIFKDIKTS